MLTGVLRKFFQEVVVPELAQIRAETAEIKTTLQLTNKRLDDLNTHLADQSRRIDAVRVELAERIESVRVELAERIESVRTELTHRLDETNKRIDETNKRIDETNKRIDAVRDGLFHKIDETNRRIDETNDRLTRLYEVIVRREEHEGLAQRVAQLEQKLEAIIARLAA